MACHHIWGQSDKDQQYTIEGLTSILYTHTCPKCGKVKTTQRVIRRMPPAMKWRRELFKLIKKANDDGCRFKVNGETLTTEIVEVQTTKKGN